MHDIDVKEDYLLGLGNGILDKLLLDRTTGENIIWGSFFLGDYENTLGIERKELSDVCDSYIEALESESQYEWLTKDTPENFAEYCKDYYFIS